MQQQQQQHQQPRTKQHLQTSRILTSCTHYYCFNICYFYMYSCHLSHDSLNGIKGLRERLAGPASTGSNIVGGRGRSFGSRHRHADFHHLGSVRSAARMLL